MGKICTASSIIQAKKFLNILSHTKIWFHLVNKYKICMVINGNATFGTHCSLNYAYFELLNFFRCPLRSYVYDFSTTTCSIRVVIFCIAFSFPIFLFLLLMYSSLLTCLLLFYFLSPCLEHFICIYSALCYPFGHRLRCLWWL